MQLHWHDNPQYRFASAPDLARDPTLRRNIARLSEYGWAFDLQVFAPQMAGAAELADARPGVSHLQHAGMLEDLSLVGSRSPPAWCRWRSGPTWWRNCPLGTFFARNDLATSASGGETVRLFAGRCMFGSNFLIEALDSLRGVVRCHRR
jgi:predicted TIM-barrel fold metal-dependent hydrolase